MTKPFARATPLAIAGLLLATLLAYAPVYRAGFVWDDTEHVLANANLRSPAGLLRTWLEPRSLPQYYPLVHTTFWLEYQVWGKHPLGYHAVNVALHGLVSVLVLLLLRRLAVPGALLAAFLFALHPVHVESVAWVSERKNVLSGLFYVAALLALVRCFRLEASAEAGPARADRSTRATWVLGLLFFVAALFSKTVTATLPAAVLLVCWWRRGRLARRELLALLPFFALGLALGLNTARLEREHVGAFGPEWALSPAERLLVAGRVPWFYAAKLAWPRDLSFVYPRFTVDASDVRQYACVAAAAGVLLALYLLRARIGRGPFAAVAFFCGTLLPALGFFDVYPMRFSFVADHFQYLASLGLLVLAAAGLARLVRSPSALARRTALAAALVVPLVLAGATLARARVFRDAETLWRDTLARNPGCWLCLNNLGVELAGAGRLDEAERLLAEAVRRKPDYAEAHVNLGFALARSGRLIEAVAHYDRALEQPGRHAAAHYSRGQALARLGRLDEAVESFRAAARVAPGDARVQADLGRALALQGRWGEAVVPMQRGLGAHPADAEPRRELAFVLNAAGRHAEALVYAREALTLAPESIAARLELARTLAALGDAAGARAASEEVLRRAPGHEEARALRDRVAAGPP